MDGVTSSANAKELMGLQGIIDTTTFSTVFEGVDRTVYPQFQGNVIDAGGALVSHDFLQQCLNRTAMVGGLEPTTLRTNYGQARNFMNTELQKTRYEPGTIDAGVTKLSWGKYQWDVDHTCPLFTVFFINKEYFEKFEVEDLSLSNLPGNSLYQMQGTDSIGGYYVYNGNIGTWKPNAHSKGINLLEPRF
jgi:hypothetical protein